VETSAAQLILNTSLWTAISPSQSPSPRSPVTVTVTEIPEYSLPVTVTEIPEYSLPVTVTEIPEYSLPVTVTEIPLCIPTIESCDSAGVKKDIFAVFDEVYGTGTGYRPLTTYNVYLVEDVTWVDGMAIPPRVPGTTTTVTSDASGNIPATLLWSKPFTPGKYDIIVDVDGDDLYHAEIDALDDHDIT
jgi:hypothetical protein